MKTTRTSNQKRSSTPIAIGFVVIAAACWYGRNLYSAHMLANAHFEPIVPGRVNVVGIDPSAGYQIIVANRMAQLAQASGGFGAQESESGGATEGAIKKRIPVKEMLGSLQGNTKALSQFVSIMNDMEENEQWPPIRVVWTAEDIRKAIAGDAALRTKLEDDLNVTLAGKPLSKLRLASLSNGIILDYPVPVKVNLNGKETTLIGRVREPFKPKLVKNVEAQYKEKPNVTNTMILGYYEYESQLELAHPKQLENVAKALEAEISSRHAATLAEAPERVLRSAQVVVNEKFIKGATVHAYDTTKGTMYDLTIDLNDAGRMRLWKYSHDRMNSHLLLVTDGIPIAAPLISDELSEGELTITQMEDKSLVDDAAQMLNESAAKEAKL